MNLWGVVMDIAYEALLCVGNKFDEGFQLQLDGLVQETHC